MTQVQLSAASGIDRAFLSEIEYAKVSVSVDLVDRWARALDVPVDALFMPQDPHPAVPPMPRGRKRRTAIAAGDGTGPASTKG